MLTKKQRDFADLCLPFMVHDPHDCNSMKEGRDRTVDGPEEKKAHTERPDPPASPAQMSTHQRKAAATAKAKATKPRARAKAMPRYSFDQFAYMTSSYLVLMY